MATDIPTIAPGIVFGSSGFRLLCRRVPHAAPTKPHRHSFTELVIVTGGRGEHLTDGECYPIGAGDVFVLRGTASHCYSNPADLSLVNIMYDADAIRLPVLDLGSIPGYRALFDLDPVLRRKGKFSGHFRLTARDRVRTEDQVLLLEGELAQKRPGWQFAAVARLMLLLAALSRSYTHTHPAEARHVMRIGEVLGFMERRCHEKITVPLLCDKAHMSRSSLHRWFMLAVGRAPIDHLLYLRVHRAANLLRTTDLTIARIASRCGFAHGSHLSRHFSKTMGVSPRAYRRDPEPDR